MGAIFLEKVCQSQNSVFSLIRMREINYPIWLPVGLSGKFSKILVFMADMKVHLLTFRREDGLCQRVGRNQKRDVESCYIRAQAVSSHAARRGQLPRRLETVYVAPPPVACLTSCVAQFRGIEKKYILYIFYEFHQNIIWHSVNSTYSDGSPSKPWKTQSRLKDPTVMTIDGTSYHIPSHNPAELNISNSPSSPAFSTYRQRLSWSMPWHPSRHGCRKLYKLKHFFKLSFFFLFCNTFSEVY